MTLFDELAAVITTFEDAGIDYALVGGLAVAVWGAPRATADIDLLIRPESVEAAVKAVSPIGFRFPALPMTFKDGMSLQRVSKLAEGALLTLDLLVVNEALEPVWASRQPFDVDGREVWVVSREALIQMKAAAGRPQDALDIQNLEEVDR